MSAYNLPEDCALWNYGGDLLMVGVGMTAGRYAEIKATLPAETQEKLIGWRCLAAL